MRRYITKIQVTKGQGIIRILYDEYASCLIIKEPKIINWPDCGGSIAEYFSVSDFSPEERLSLTKSIDIAISSGDEDNIIKVLPTFLDLFENGDYSINFGNIELSEAEFITDKDTCASHIPENERFRNFYPFRSWQYFYTIPYKKINQQRVSFYKQAIMSGSRPKVVIYDVSYANPYEYIGSSMYVLDGHHKIQAYIDLGLEIPYVSIVKKEDKYSSSLEVFNNAYKILKDFEFEHFFVNHDDGLLTVDFSQNKFLTSIVDRLLIEKSTIDISIINLLKKYAEHDPVWLEERLDKLKKNEAITAFNGLRVYYWKYERGNYYTGYVGHIRIINTLSELQFWIDDTVKNNNLN